MNGWAKRTIALAARLPYCCGGNGGGGGGGGAEAELGVESEAEFEAEDGSRVS